jgi:hypothetical protein
VPAHTSQCPHSPLARSISDPSISSPARSPSVRSASSVSHTHSNQVRPSVRRALFASDETARKKPKHDHASSSIMSSAPTNMNPEDELARQRRARDIEKFRLWSEAMHRRMGLSMDSGTSL